MTYNYQIQNIHKENAFTCTCVFICYMRTCMDPGNFAMVVGGPSQTGRKEPWQLFSPQLILQLGPNVYFKETIIFPESKQAGQKCQGVLPFPRWWGPIAFFYRTCTPPPWIRALPMCTCPYLWPFKVTKTKHAVSSSKAYAFRVIKK